MATDLWPTILTGDVDKLRKVLGSARDPRSVARSVNSIGQSALYCAVSQSPPSASIVRLLLEAGADPNDTYTSKPIDFPTDFLIDLPPEMAQFEELLKARPLMEPSPISTFSTAIQTGDMDIVCAFVEHGADPRSVDASGYSTVLQAVGAAGDAKAVVEYLLQLGASPDGASMYGETAIVQAMRHARYEIVQTLIDHGVDESPIRWTPLIRAVALGRRDDFELTLASNPELNARDAVGNTALDVALRRGHHEFSLKLIEAGAWIDGGSLTHACFGGQIGLVQRIVAAGVGLDEVDQYGQTALATAVALGHTDIVNWLLDAGAAMTVSEWSSSLLESASNAEITRALLRAGADPRGISTTVIRTLCNLPSDGLTPLRHVTRKQYLAARHFRPGKKNPEDVTEPFKVAMILSGANAYFARTIFDDDAKFSCGISFSRRPPQVWCFDRFGQSYTLLADGRAVLIGGEHEDSYDPDFCIYNDVTVIDPDGTIRIYGYPLKSFEPTDFHTATLIADSIWIIGGIGYPDQRHGSVPVYRLDVRDFSIQRMQTTGAVVPRVYRHLAALEGRSIRVFDGQTDDETPGDACSEPNVLVSATLDTKTLVWTIDS